jgi:ribosome-binding factor A
VKSHHKERQVAEIRDAIAAIVAGGLKDPRLGLVTVTRVELSPDLEHAKVFVGVLGEGARRDEVLRVLTQAAGFVRRELGRRVRMRQVPQLSFRYDKGLDAADRVARLLEEVKDEKPPGGAQG